MTSPDYLFERDLLIDVDESDEEIKNIFLNSTTTAADDVPKTPSATSPFTINETENEILLLTKKVPLNSWIDGLKNYRASAFPNLLGIHELLFFKKNVLTFIYIILNYSGKT